MLLECPSDDDPDIGRGLGLRSAVNRSSIASRTISDSAMARARSVCALRSLSASSAGVIRSFRLVR
jgi:hypothetical protein